MFREQLIEAITAKVAAKMEWEAKRAKASVTRLYGKLDNVSLAKLLRDM